MVTRNIINSIVLIVSDLLFVTSALFISHGERLWLDGFRLFDNYDADPVRYMFSGLLYIFLPVLFFYRGLYQKRNDFWEESRIIMQSVLILFVLIAAYVFLTKTSLYYSRTMVILLFINLLWVLPIGRVAAKKFLTLAGSWQVSAYIDGNEVQAEKLSGDLAANWFLGYRSVANFADADIVFIATKGMAVEQLEEKIAFYRHQIPEVVVIPYLSNLSFANAEIIDLRIGQVSMINIQNQLYRSKNIALKNSMEFMIVMLLLPIFFLVYSVIALWIKFDSLGPVLYRQKRLGKNGEQFECYKFRTMAVGSDAVLDAYLQAHPEEVAYYEQFHKYRNDPRITKAGYWLRRFSFDELPQMLNILKGEMSLIGPRPYMLEERSILGENVETILHVRPGLTGFWQIKGRNDLSFAERVELDVWYIRNWSLWLDFIIFIKTFEVLVTRRGAR